MLRSLFHVAGFHGKLALMLRDAKSYGCGHKELKSPKLHQKLITVGTDYREIAFLLQGYLRMRKKSP